MKLLIFHASAGHGHQKVAEVIAAAFMAQQKTGDEYRIFDALALTPRWFRHSYRAFYYNAVKYAPLVWGWFYEALDFYRLYGLLHPLRRLNNKMVGGNILKEVQTFNPDVIVCTHFLTAELLSQAKLSGKISGRIVVVITDFYPHTFWVNPGTDVYWVMSQETKTDLIHRKIPAEKIIVGGIPVDPIFKPNGMRDEVLKKYKFDPGRFTILLTSGSFGLGPQEKILSYLAEFSSRIQCFVVCGNNKKVFDSIQKKNYSYPVKVFGFVDFMAELMEGSDLLIAKPGGATTTESLVKNLPMVVMDPIPGQESRNVLLLKQRNAAFFIKYPEQIKLILKTVLDQPELLEEKKKSIRNLARPEAAADFIHWMSK